MTAQGVIYLYAIHDSQLTLYTIKDTVSPLLIISEQVYTTDLQK